jgi:integrase
LGYTPNGPKDRYLYGKTRQVVAEKLTKAMAQRDSGLVFETGKLTVAGYMNKWLTESARNRLRPKTYKDYSGLTRLHIIPALGHIKLKKLTPLHVQSFYGSKLESGLSKRTVEYIHTVLHSALKQAVRWELVPRNVTEAVDPPREEGTPDFQPGPGPPLLGGRSGRWLGDTVRAGHPDWDAPG